MLACARSGSCATTACSIGARRHNTIRRPDRPSRARERRRPGLDRSGRPFCHPADGVTGLLADHARFNTVAVSLSAIALWLGASFTEMQWVISAYVLTYAALSASSGTPAVTSQKLIKTARSLARRRPSCAGSGEPSRGENCMIVVHHLDDSRSQRVLWLSEELGLPNEIEQHRRDPVTRLAPPELRRILAR